MAFCDQCDEPVKFLREEDWTDAPNGTGTVYRYECDNSGCDSDGGEVYALAGGGLHHEEGIW